jgi:hypothetical protein
MARRPGGKGRGQAEREEPGQREPHRQADVCQATAAAAQGDGSRAEGQHEEFDAALAVVTVCDQEVQQQSAGQHQGTCEAGPGAQRLGFW